MRSGTLAAASVAVAVGAGALYAGPVFRAALVADLGWSNELAAGAFAVGYLAAGASPIVSGIVADRFGPSRLLVAGLLLAALGLFGAAMTSVPWHWYLTAGVGLAFELHGLATDDGLPAPPGQITSMWSQVSGPTSALILDPDRLTTEASASEVGIYVFTLQASDGAIATVDSVNVNVVPLTSVSATGQVEDGIRAVGPMPVRGAAEIRFGVHRDGALVSLTLNDVAGRRLATLASDTWTAGEHRVAWNGRDSNGHRVSSGIYFLHLEVDGRGFTTKVPVLH